MSIALLLLFAIAGALLVYMFVDMFKGIRRSKEVMSPREREYVLSALFGSPVRSALAAYSLKAEDDDFLKAKADCVARLPSETWWYDIEQREHEVSVRLGLRADAEACFTLSLPFETTRGDALRAAMAEAIRRWRP